MTNQYINQAGSDALPKLSAPTLNSSAMLVEVNISKWEGRKLDKKASEIPTMLTLVLQMYTRSY